MSGAPTAKQTGRLAMRLEGNTWNAYYARPDTMAGAIWLGGIAFRLVDGTSAATIRRKDAFMRMMSDAVADLLEGIVGEKPQMNHPVAAPEHERGGNA